MKPAGYQIPLDFGFLQERGQDTGDFPKPIPKTVTPKLATK